MRNPLIKRIPKELRSDWHKYAVIIIFMVMMIGLISGMYVGHDSMLAAIDRNVDRLNLEDGSFELSSRASQEMLEALESGEMADVRQHMIDEGVNEYGEEYRDLVTDAVDEEWNDIADEYGLDSEGFTPVPVTVYEHFFRNESEDYNNDGVEDGTVRIYRSDSEVDMANFNVGRAPESANEIAIDRMHADNVGVGIGDTITVGGREFEIVGLISYVNYLTLHENNNDMMFNAFSFDVGMVTPEAFDELTSRLHYSYAYFYDATPADRNEEADFADSMLKALISQSLVYDNDIEDFLPEYLRQASNFAPEDIGHDTAGTTILCYILIAVIAFIFAITINTTIEKEASVIGTLRASGYSKGELIVHYMSMPLIVTLVGAVIGNVIGYTWFMGVAKDLYYNSYSLPTCEAVLSTDALIKTTVIPLVLMFFINLFVIVAKLHISPLRFLRHDLSRTKKSKARRLPSWSFLGRFRLRIVFQNMPNYAVLVFGVIFIELMLCFAFGLPDSLTHYADEAPGMTFADYQYMLMRDKDDDGEYITTSEETAEIFSATGLMYPKNLTGAMQGFGSGGDESVTVYGIIDDSAYVDIDGSVDDYSVYVSSSFAAKFGTDEGDVITLHEQYENKSYEFTVVGVVDYDGGIAVFMPNDNFNRVFGLDEGDFSGFLSRNEITDIDGQDIAVVITVNDIIKVTTQLMHSMGDMMEVFQYVLIVLAAALIYLLAKIIIEKNENAISMVKILGFHNGEIGSLYILPTAIIVTIVTLISLGVGYFLMLYIFKVFMYQMDGYFEYYMKPVSLVLSAVYLLVGYAFVSVIDFIRIKKIPMDVALKNVD